MRSDPPSPVRIEFTPEFKRNIRRLSKKYRSIRSDIQPVLDQLVRGETPGDRIVGTRHVVYKVRAGNSDLGRGKSGGYRLIYYLVTESSIVLLTLYSKTEQGDITSDEIVRIIESTQSS